MAVAIQNQVLCDLCGLPAHAPIAAEIGERAFTFCCAGCRQVYQILAESDQVGKGRTRPRRRFTSNVFRWG